MEQHRGEAEKDEEGRQTMRTLARNMTFLMKSIALGKEQFGLPEKKQRFRQILFGRTRKRQGFVKYHESLPLELTAKLSCFIVEVAIW